MEVILLERLDKLGQIGDIVNVKAGFARNYLFPKGKALRATENNKNQFEGQRSQLEAKNLKLKTEATDIASRMESMLVTLIRQAGDAGQLYGSVNTRNIAIAVSEMGVTIARQQVLLPTPIKTIGIHKVKVQLHPEVPVIISVNIARSEDEAKTQSKTGVAVISTTDKEDEVPTPDPEKTTKEIFEKSAEKKAISDIISENDSPDDLNVHPISDKQELPE